MMKVFVPILFFDILQSVYSTSFEDKCENKTYFNCSIQAYRRVTLWCDASNLTSIPHPLQLLKTKNYFAPPQKSSYLFMNQSCVNRINRGAMEEFDRLELLDLTDNFVETLEIRGFGEHKKLSTLYLSRNTIRLIKDEAFVGLEVLTHLYLDHNQLKELGANAFHSLSRLQVLKLNDNKLKKISQNSFREFENLLELDLSGNDLEIFLPTHLKSLGKLRVLNLSRNRLTSFDAINIFLASPKIEELFLNNNSISCFEDVAFKDEENLLELHIGNNPLKTPSLNWFGLSPHGSKSSRRSVHFSATAWVCDCKAFSYVFFFKKFLKEDSMIKRYDLQCSSPSAFRGRMLSEIDWDEYHQYYTESECEISNSHFTCPQELFIAPENLISNQTITGIPVKTPPRAPFKSSLPDNSIVGLFESNPAYVWIAGAVVIVLSICIIAFTCYCCHKISLKSKVEVKSLTNTDLRSSNNVEPFNGRQTSRSDGIEWVNESRGLLPSDRSSNEWTLSTGVSEMDPLETREMQDRRSFDNNPPLRIPSPLYHEVASGNNSEQQSTSRESCSTSLANHHLPVGEYACSPLSPPFHPESCSLSVTNQNPPASQGLISQDPNPSSSEIMVFDAYLNENNFSQSS